MSTPSLIIHQRSPSSPTIPLEPDFSSPPVMRPYPPNTRPQPISPQLGGSYGSDVTSVSDTIRPDARPHAHVQPGSSFANANTPSFTFGSTASSSATAGIPATRDAGQSSSTFTPPRFKFVGRQSPSDATAGGPEHLPAGLFRPTDAHTMMADPSSQASLATHGPPPVSRAAPPASASGTSRPDNTLDRAALAANSLAPVATHVEAYRQPLTRPPVDHLQAFEQGASMRGGWLNELGTLRHGIPAAASRSSLGSEQGSSQHHAPPLDFPLHFPLSRSGAPPVRPRFGFVPDPVAIPPDLRPTGYDEPTQRSGVGNLLFAYGSTGPLLEQEASRAISPISLAATDGSAMSAMPSVPPPRPSRSMISDLYHDREDFSPHRLGRRSRDEVEERFDRPNPTQAFGAIRPTSQMHQDRLARADAFRLRAGQYDPVVPAGQWTRAPYFDDHYLSAQMQVESRGRSSAADISSRQGRFALDDNRDLRSRIRRRLSISDTESVGDRDGSTEIGTWNRNVQDAIGRRVAGDQPHSPASAARRHREISNPYFRPRPTPDREASDAERQPPPWDSGFQRDMAWATHDTIPVDTLGSEPRDPMHMHLPTAFGWSGHFAPSSATLLPRQRIDSANMFNDVPADTLFGSVIDSPDTQYRVPGEMDEMLDAAGMEDEVMEGHMPGLYPRVALSASAARFATHWAPYGLDPAAYPPRLAPQDMLGHLNFTPEMDQAERIKVARSIAKGIVRWPGLARRRAAETVVENTPWGDVKSTEEMERDVCCSVCHDDYEPESKVSVTPCKHMYHKDCLDTWLQTPNTSSCPMCRRDLAVLACVTKMVPSKKREEAMPIWLAL